MKNEQKEKALPSEIADIEIAIIKTEEIQLALRDLQKTLRRAQWELECKAREPLQER